jgi:hypothetical protein
LLVSGVGGFKALAFAGQLGGESCGAGRSGLIVLGLGVGGLPVGVGFGLRGEPKLPADVGRAAARACSPWMARASSSDAHGKVS